MERDWGSDVIYLSKARERKPFFVNVFSDQWDCKCYEEMAGGYRFITLSNTFTP
jgi:hypothetical protein